MNSDEYAALAKAREENVQENQRWSNTTLKEITYESNQEKGTKADDEPHVSSTTIKIKNERNSHTPWALRSFVKLGCL